MLHVLVTGATGQVGGAVATRLLQRGHRVRAFVRDPEAPRAQALADAGAELAPGTFTNSERLEAAVAGVDAVFLLTTPNAGVAAEVAGGEAVADAAAAAGVRHLVVSSVADAANRTGIPHFDSKAAIAAHVESLGLPFTAVGPAFFYENVLFPWNLAALREGRWSQALPPDRPLKMIGVGDIAAFVVHALEHRDDFVGRTVDIAADELSGPEVAAALQQASGSAVEYVAQSLEDVRAQFEDMAPMYEWLDRQGFSVEPAEVRAAYPEIGWTSFAQWAASQDWHTLQGRPGLDIRKVDHVGIRVRDKAKSVAFYESLGFETLSDTGFEHGHPVILQHACGVVLNLLGPATTPPGPNVLMDVPDKAPGYTHMALRVGSLDAVRRFLEEHAIDVTGGFEFGGVRALFIRDPDANVIEFDEYAGEQPGTRARREGGGSV